MTHPITRKLPAHRGCFSYSRIPMDGGAVVYRLFRRDLMRRVHAVRRNFHPDCGRACMAQELNIARHHLRNAVDEIDLEIMGLTLELSGGPNGPSDSDAVLCGTHSESGMDLEKYAAVGDVIECMVTNPFPQKITARLETPEAAAYANTLLSNERSGWRKVDLPHNDPN